MAELVDVTEANFDEEILQSETPALVDFWGDHCPACRQISPILEELADEHAGRIKIVKLHAAENPGVSARYSVLSMPTVLGFSSGEVVGQLVGARPKSAFEELIERLR